MCGRPTLPLREASNPQDLINGQACCLLHHKGMAPEAGLEPATLSLTATCTAIVLLWNVAQGVGIEPTWSWFKATAGCQQPSPEWSKGDSNPRPLPCHGSVLAI
jgi:hypothetical protein